MSKPDFSSLLGSGGHMNTLAGLRALEKLALASDTPVSSAMQEKARLIARLLYVIDDGSEEFAAMADLVNVIAYKDMPHDKAH